MPFRHHFRHPEQHDDQIKSIPAAMFYGCIQKPYDSANRYIELGGMYVEG